MAFIDAGTTAHFDVLYEDNLGQQGGALASAVLATCERDYATLTTCFGGVDAMGTIDGFTFGLPVIVQLETKTQYGSGYHRFDDFNRLHITAFVSPLDVELTLLVVGAELVESFSAAGPANAYWGPANSMEEALSQALARVLHPQSWHGGQGSRWLQSNRPDYVNSTIPTDGEDLANGCGVEFLFFLRDYLGFDWLDIIAAGHATLGDTYRTLSTVDDPWGRFSAALQDFPDVKPVNDNPFASTLSGRELAELAVTVLS